MATRISRNVRTVYHNEVVPIAEGKGTARRLSRHNMVSHARKNSLEIVALCHYVHRRFQQNSEVYADGWKQ
jgi:predicted GNAT family acetyltransferase